jgi:hypothetical protein
MPAKLVVALEAELDIAEAYDWTGGWALLWAELEESRGADIKFVFGGGATPCLE